MTSRKGAVAYARVRVVGRCQDCGEDAWLEVRGLARRVVCGCGVIVAPRFFAIARAVGHHPEIRHKREWTLPEPELAPGEGVLR